MAEAGIFSTCSGKTVPQNLCAILYDDDDCSGWEGQVPIGYKELPRFSLGGPRKDDAESVLVRPGCKFIGKGNSEFHTTWGCLFEEHGSYSNLAERKIFCSFIPGYSDDGQRGDTVVVDNTRSTRPLSKNFKSRADLHERIESTFCSCNR